MSGPISSITSLIKPRHVSRKTLNFTLVFDSNQWNVVTGALHTALIVSTRANRLPNARFYLKCNRMSLR